MGGDQSRPAIPTFLSFDAADADGVAAIMRRHPVALADARSVGITAGDDLTRLADPHRITAEVRRRYIRDAALTVLVVGQHTWKRRFVDWELAAAAEAGCGLLAFPLTEGRLAVPARLRLFAEAGGARIHHRPPASDEELASWMTAAVATPASSAPSRASQTPLLRRDARPTTG